MFRWIRTLAKRFALYLRVPFASRPHFGGQRKRLAVRVPRRTVKLDLEVCEPRLVPSATVAVPMQALMPVVQASSAPGETSSAADQRIHLISIIRNDVSSVEAALSQEVAQVTAYVVQRWDTILGIEPNTPSQPSAGSGVGSGTGTTTTAHNALNQQSKAIVPQSGIGSGSGANTNVHEAAVTRTVGGNASKQGMTPLVGSGSGSGSGITPTVGFAGSIGSGPFYEEVGSGSDYATREVVLSAPTTHTVTVNYSTGGGSATAGVDYDGESGTLTFTPGETTQTIKIPILDDGTDESDGSEYFDETLSNPSGATLGIYYVSAETIAEHPPQQATDTLQWNPEKGSSDASVVTNWYDLTQGFQLENGDPGVGAQTTVVVNGTPDSQTSKDEPIVWTNSVAIATMVIQNGYAEQQTVDAALTLFGYEDQNIGVNNFLVSFAGPNAALNLNRGQDVMGNFNWENVGNVFVNGANVMIGNGAGLNQSTDAPVTINSGTVSIGPNTAGGTSTFNLATASADITVNANGQLDFYAPSAADTLVHNNLKGAQIINNGTTYLVGNNSDAKATINAPFENHGILNADTGGNWYFHVADNAGNDLFMDQGKIFLMDEAYISCQDAYRQTGGTLEIGDTQNEILWAQLGNVNFNGGKIVFSASNGFGTLEVPKVVFNGVEIDMRIAGSNSSSDQILAESATTTIKGNSKLVVTALNPVQKGSKITWTLIQPDAGDTITGDFGAFNITLPANVVETAGALPNSWQCNS